MRDKKREVADYIEIEGFSANDIYAIIERPQDLSKGDYALPCFRFSKILRKSPVQIAESIRDSILAKEHPFEAVEAVNGFLNFKFDKKKETVFVINEILTKGTEYGSSSQGKGKDRKSVV